VLELQGKATPEIRAAVRSEWNEMHQGTSNAMKIAILQNGAKFTKTSIDPEDAQFLSTRQFQVIEIARLFRVPPHKIGDYSQAHLANLEESNTDYVTTTLMPWCEAIEQTCNMRLL